MQLLGQGTWSSWVSCLQLDLHHMSAGKALHDALVCCAVTRTSGLSLWKGGRSGAPAEPCSAAEAAPEVPSFPLRRVDKETPRASLDPNGLPEAAGVNPNPGHDPSPDTLGSPRSPARAPKAQPSEVVAAAHALLANGGVASNKGPKAIGKSPLGLQTATTGDPTPGTPAPSRAVSLMTPPPPLPPPPGFVAAALVRLAFPQWASRLNHLHSYSHSLPGHAWGARSSGVPEVSLSRSAMDKS